MTSSKPRTKRQPETVTVVVVVNHDDLRRGETGAVELTPTVRNRLDRGFLRLAEPEESEPQLPVAALGSTAGRGREPQGVLLGVDGVPGSVVVGMGGGTGDPGGTGNAAP